MENLGNLQAQTYLNDAGYEVLMKRAALVDRSHRILLRLAGKNSTEMLNAVLTNVVPKEDNLGTYAALLSPKGRIQTDLRVLKADGEVFVDAEPEGAGAAQEILGRYAPFSRVTVEDLSESSWGVLGLYGPHAEELLGNLRLAEHESARIKVAGSARILAVGVATPVPGFDLLGPADTLRLIREHLLNSGTILAGSDAYETARVAAGVPRFGADITPENFPAEANILARAVNFEKGCYPGQETVARMHYRGHPNKTLRRLVIDGAPPPPNTPITQNEKQVGRITSIAPLPIDGKILALGYLSHNTNTDVSLAAGEVAISLAP
jgi:folate-binding protein YgfZ